MGPAQALQARLGGIAAVITSGAFAMFIRSSINMQDEMSKSAQKAGVTTEQFSGMAYAAKLADVEADQLAKTYSKLNALLSDGQQGQKEAVNTFRRLKFDPKSFKDADGLLLALADRFSSMPDGIGKTALAIDVFGERLGPGLIPFLNSGREGLQALREEAARLGVVISTQAGKEAEELNDTMTRLQTNVQGVQHSLAVLLLPALQEVAGGMNTLLTKVRAINREGGFLASMGKEIKAGKLSDDLTQVVREIESLQATIDRQGGDSLLDKKMAGLRRRASDLSGELQETTGWLKRFAEAADPSTPAGDPAPAGTPGKPFVPGSKPPPILARAAADTERSVLATYELVLAEDKRAAAILDVGAEYGKERELAFWRSLLDSAQMGAADRTTILRKAAALEIDIAGKAARDRLALDAELLSQSEQFALGKVDGERAAAKSALDLGQITTVQQLQLDALYEQQRYEIQRAALQRRLELLAADPTSSEVEKQRLIGRLLQLEQQYQTQALQIQAGLTKEGLNPAIFDSMGTSFTSSLQSMLTGAQTWRQSLAGIFRSTGDIFLAEVVSKPAAQYIASQARLLAAKLGFVASETAATTAGSATTIAVKGVETSIVVGANAAQAGAGAAAAMAPIPIVGPGLALAAMAAIFAAVSSIGGKSAAGGYDIPSGINPLTQLHEEEMVLPAHIANPLRGALADGDLGGGGGRQGGDMNINIRGAGAGDFFMVHKADLVKALRSARRDLAF